jgi:hypothetical protein
MILVDTSSQAWDIEVRTAGTLYATAVGGSGPTSVLINDFTIPSTTYSLSLNVVINGTPNIVQTPTTFSSNPTRITLHTPGLVAFYLEIVNGQMLTTSATFNDAQDFQIFREAIIPVPKNQYIVIFVST